MEYKIQVGKSITIKKGLVSNLKLLYGGMPNEQTFTICPLVQNGNVGHSPNIYYDICLLYTSPSPRDKRQSRMPSSA